MRILVVGDGSRGDVQPMGVLAGVLKQEGHVVTVAAPPTMRSLIEQHGVTFVPLALDSEALVRNHASAIVAGGTAVLRAAPRLFLESLHSQMQSLPELVRQNDFILVGGVHIGIPSLAEWAGIPWRWVIFTSSMYPSNAHPPITAPIGHAPRFINYLLWRLTRWHIDRMLRGPINLHRKRLGLTPLTSTAEHILCPNPILAMDPELTPPLDEWPGMDTIGFLDPGAGDPLPGYVEDFLASGPAPIYIGFGSMPDPNPELTTKLFVQAAQRAGTRLILSRGWAGFGSELPEHCLAVRSVSHTRLFTRVSAIVHHGGAGTSAAATRAGKPQLVVPHLADQFYFSARLHALGIAARPVRRSRLTAARLARRIDRLLHDEALREQARVLGETLRARPPLSNLSRLLRSYVPPQVAASRSGRRVPTLPPA